MLFGPLIIVSLLSGFLIGFFVNFWSSLVGKLVVAQSKAISEYSLKILRYLIRNEDFNIITFLSLEFTRSFGSKTSDCLFKIIWFGIWFH
jgi:hypothetical protein